MGLEPTVRPVPPASDPSTAARISVDSYEMRTNPLVVADKPLILVPIRYPLTDKSTRTLEYAGKIALDHTDPTLVILHVNLFQDRSNTQAAEITRAITPILGDHEPSVIIRRGFLVEEVILEEVDRLGPEIIVIGENQKPRWRRLLSRLVGNDPSIATFLRIHSNTTIELVG